MKTSRTARLWLLAAACTGLLAALGANANAFTQLLVPSILEGDAVPDLLVSPENSAQPTRVLSGVDGAELGAGFPFGPLPGGNRLAAGDLNGDGVPDIVAGMGPGGSYVTLFDGATLANLGGGAPFGAFGGGVFLAVGDLNGDGRNDIGVSQGAGGGLVRVFSGADYGLLLNLAPFGAGYTGGVTLAMGDVNADGRSDLIVGQLAGGQVAVIDGATQALIVAGAPFGGHTGGVSVAAGDVNGDGRSDVILAPATQGGVVVVYDLQSVTLLGSFLPYGNSFTAGVRLAAADLTGDGRADIITAPGPGGGNQVRVHSGNGFAATMTVAGYAAGYNSGIFVAAPVAPAIRFTSAASATFTVGEAGNFVVRTSGGRTLSVTGTLPAGVTFTDNGNGTATLSGTPSAPGGAYALTFTATAPGSRPVTQPFSLTVQQPPAVTSGAAATFAIGALGTFEVTSSGYPVPTVSISGALPAGVGWTPGPNGTATLSGTPTTGSAGSYSLTVSASNGVGTPATQNLVLTVTATAAITSAATTTFTVGQPGTFTITTAGNPPVTSITRTGTLPTGILFTDLGNGTATLAGTPATGTGGTYPLTFTASNGAGAPAIQNFTLIVDAPVSAGDDAYSNGVGNTAYVVGGAAPATPAVVVSGSVLDNDHGSGALTAGPALIASVNGGQVAMAANGSFLYTPPVGFAGPSDSFTYTATDAQNRADTATVTINLSGVVWYVNGAAAAGDGRSHAPFNTLGAAVAAAAPGQAIYVYAGTYSGSVPLQAGQTLWGAGAAFTLNGLSLPAGTSPTLLGTVSLANASQVTGVTVNGGAGAAIVGSAVTTTATVSVVNVIGGATGVLVNGGTGTLNIGATIANAGGRLIDVENHTAGTITFSGPVTDTSGTGSGILLASNAGATIAFTGGVTIATGVQNAFTATGGGRVIATQNNTTVVNTLSTTDGVALLVSNTGIGAEGLTFRSISAGTSSYSAGVGILLQSTGVAPGDGGLTITGNGTASSGGFIRRKNGPDGSLTSGIGIALLDTKSPTIRWMEMYGFTNTAILARNVAGFELTNSSITDAGTTSGEGPLVFGAPNPGGVNGLVTGTTALIRDSLISGGYEHNVAYYGQSGAISLQVERTTPTPGDCSIQSNSTTTGGAGIAVLLEGAATTGNVTVNQCRLRDNRLAGLLARATGAAALTVSVTGAEVIRGGDGIVLANAGDASITSTITGNVISGVAGANIRLGQDPGNASSLSMLRATITGNDFDAAAGATDAVIAGRFSSTAGQVAQTRLLVANNGAAYSGALERFRVESSFPGILITTPDASTTPLVNLTVSGNHVDLIDPDNDTLPGTRNAFGIDVQAAQGTVCGNITGNLSHWFPTTVGAGGGVRALQTGAGVFQLERGLQPLGTDAATVLQVNNSTHPVGAATTTLSGTVAVVENGSCQLPSAP